MPKHATALLLAAFVCVATPAAGANASHESRAQALYRDALRRLAIGTPEQRQFARGQLEQAAILQPDDQAIALALGQLYVQAPMLREARNLAQSLVRRHPGLGAGHFLLGEVWRREWLINSDQDARDRAIASLARGLRCDPDDFAHAQMLVPMLEDAGEAPEALEMAQLAARAAPSDPDAWLLLGYAAQVAGDVALSHRMFTKALAALPAARRRDYEDLSSILPPSAAESFASLPTPERAARTERYWRTADPDPVSVENEAQLEFWSRITHALLLYGKDELGAFDARAQLYIRFGPPRFADRRAFHMDKTVQGTWLTWTYPDLGMRAWMLASNPLAHYRAPRGVRVQAFPESVAVRQELQGVHGGWAVFRAVPAGMTPLPARCAVARFAGRESGVLHAQVETAADPAAPITADWVVLDTTSRVVARARNELGPSACGQGDVRAASYTSPLPAGRYRLGVRLDDGDGHRTALSRDVVIPAGSTGLQMSDLAVVCGGPALGIVPGGGLRLELSTGLMPQSGDQLNVYCEIYRLATNVAGDASFEYVCRVKSSRPDNRSWLRRMVMPLATPTPIEMTRRETTRGDLRRQYFSVPVHGLPPGRYRMEVTVRDLATGAEATASADFERG